MWNSFLDGKSNKHIKETHKVDLKKCEECNLSFEEEEYLKQHVHKEHKQNILIQQKKKGLRNQINRVSVKKTK